MDERDAELLLKLTLEQVRRLEEEVAELKMESDRQHSVNRERSSKQEGQLLAWRRLYGDRKKQTDFLGRPTNAREFNEPGFPDHMDPAELARMKAEQEADADG